MSLHVTTVGALIFLCALDLLLYQLLLPYFPRRVSGADDTSIETELVLSTTTIPAPPSHPEEQQRPQVGRTAICVTEPSLS